MATERPDRDTPEAESDLELHDTEQDQVIAVPLRKQEFVDTVKTQSGLSPHTRLSD